MNVFCASCEGEIMDEMFFDEKSGKFFCGYQCFEEWADLNFEVVAEYYWKMNIS